MHELLGLPAALDGHDRCLVMGVINVTPDSFSDGGRWFSADDAVAQGLRLLAEGADLLDVGGESTRPGALRIDPNEELRRVVPVVERLVAAGAVVSVDTMRAGVARAALAAGAQLVNDISGGQADPAMISTVAEAGVPYVVMHWRGFSDVMESLTHYEDVVTDVCAELSRQVAALVAAGVDERRLVLDPGFGFAKNAEQNWQVFAALDRLVGLGRPVLVGTSRKRFLGQAVTRAAADGGAPGPASRDDATAATSALAAAAGAWAVRVHQVAASADAVRVAARTAQARTVAGARSAS
ncbi:MAG: dihydropteroate synthase [Kineosporiaceae bacterium]